MIHRCTQRVRPLGLLLALLALPALADAASKVKIAALGEEAPGGGVFAGPSFTDTPSAAGNGWLAFRSLVTAGTSGEQIVVQNVVTGERTTVATLGQTVTARIGRFKQFLGQPTVNANGDVAFVAVITPPDDNRPRPTDPTPAGVFLFKRGIAPAPSEIIVVAEPGLDTGIGKLDLTTPVDVLVGLNAVDIPERTPALNDAGDVAFVSSTARDDTFSGAIFFRPAGGVVAPVVRVGDPWDGGRFVVLGPPALNNVGQLAFRGVAEGGEALLDGIFRLEGGVTTLLVRDGYKARLDEPFPNEQEVTEFGGTLSMNDVGDIAFTAGPLLDLSFESVDTDDDFGTPGVFVYHAGMVFLVSYPGKPVASRGRVTSHTLAPEFGSQVAPPSLAPDGTVVFLGALNGGSSQALFTAAAGSYAVNTILVVFGGNTPDETPIGGTFTAASSATAVDATLGIAFFARIQGSTSAEALIYRPTSGNAASVRIGDAVPGGRTDGFFGGPPFFPPHLNDAGDVVFKAYVARGPGLGIFRARAGVAPSPVVRLGDPLPLEGSPAIVNLVGEPSLNASGDIAFTAVAPITAPFNGGTAPRRAIFIAGAAGLRKVVAPFDAFVDPTREGAEFLRIAPNPALNDAGDVAFRATIEYPDPIDPFVFPAIREDGVFLADATGIRALAMKGERSPVGLPFYKFFDPTVSGRGPIAFRAPLGSDGTASAGFFFADPSGIIDIAVLGDALPDGRRLVSLSGRAVLDDNGSAVFLARTTGAGGEVASIVRRASTGLTSIVQSGTPGPAGGLFRSLGRPSVTPSGTVVFRANFEPFTGGTAGFFVSDQNGIRPFVQAGEGAAGAIGGRLTAFNQNTSVNTQGNLAFIATVTGGESRNAIFVASPAKLAAPKVGFKFGPPIDLDDLDFRPKDRVSMSVALTPGSVAGNIEPAKEAVVVSVSDTKGQIWSATLPAGSLQGRGSRFSLKPSARGPINQLKLRVKKGVIRATVRSAPFDVLTTITGLREFFEDAPPEIVPPFTVRFELGDDSATATVPCKRKGRRFACGG